LLANLTVMGSVAPCGTVPFSFSMARSASPRVSNRMNPTPFDRPAAYMCLKIEAEQIKKEK
jgi:hypothetical protein